MQKLGYEKEDLDTYKRKEHFIEMPDVIPSPKGKNPDATSKKLNYMDPRDADEQLLLLRFKHY